jgi:hypothetical protein
MSYICKSKAHEDQQRAYDIAYMKHLPPVIALPCGSDFQGMASWRKDCKLHQHRVKRIEFYVDVYSARFQSYFKSVRNHAKKHHWQRLGSAYLELYGVPVTPKARISMRNALEACMQDEFGMVVLTPAELFPAAALQGPQFYGTKSTPHDLHDRICLDLKRATGHHSGTGLGRSSSAGMQASSSPAPAKKAKIHSGKVASG